MKCSQRSVILLSFWFFIFCFAACERRPQLEQTKAEKPASWSEQKIIDEFHRIFRQRGGCFGKFMGIPLLQYPTDNWIMTEIINEVKPDFIIETGTWQGGATLLYAAVLEQVNSRGKIITLDINDTLCRKASNFELWKRRVEFIKGDSASPLIVSRIAQEVKGRRVLVTLDSEHTRAHVLKELQAYAPLVSQNSYIVVQDTALEGHPIGAPSDQGPWDAVQDFLKANGQFMVDHSWERFLISQNPSGYLKRVQD